MKTLSTLKDLRLLPYTEPMNIRTRTDSLDPWIKSPAPEDRKEAGYDEALAASIERGRAQLDTGEGIPHNEFWAKWDREHAR